MLEKAEGFPEADSSETSKLRQMLLQHNNDFMQCQERTARIEQELEM